MLHVRRDSNPQPAVLETAALPIEPLTYLLSFFMKCMFGAEPAVFFVFYPARMFALVLSSAIVAMFAIVAL